MTVGKIGKRRGRPPSKRTQEKKDNAALKRHWLDCKECGKNGTDVDGDVISYICSKCVCSHIPWPKPKALPTAEEKRLKAERREARRERKDAIARGDVLPEKKELGFGRGWHRRLLFSSEVDGKMMYFSSGKEVTKTEYKKIERAQTKKVKDATKGTTGFGRGWHFKKVFYTPDGNRYELGRLIKKAIKEPTEEELIALMEQHYNGKDEK